jgi:hypothetical protein
MVTTERARHLNAPRPGAATAVDADATRNRVYVSTTREAATQTVKPQIAISGQRIDSSGGLSISSHRELARLGTGSVATGVSLQCSLSGGTYNSCEPVDLSAGAALYRDAKGGLRMMVRATTLLSTTNPAIGPEHSIGMFAGRVWSITGWQLAGDTPAAGAVPQGVNPRLDVPAITRSGTLTNGDVSAW